MDKALEAQGRESLYPNHGSQSGLVPSTRGVGLVGEVLAVSLFVGYVLKYCPETSTASPNPAQAGSLLHRSVFLQTQTVSALRNPVR